ncbi:transcriptional regulatory [Fusarium sp. NRRL 52700]|nr:transcriptional regulatory [Fusarium sp. NRRL 52700]
MAFVLVNIVGNEEWIANTEVVQTQYHQANLLVRHRGKALIENVLTRLSFPNRLSFVGRSTAHSFMHHIRNTIERRDGPSEFTADSNWSGLPERLPVTPNMQSFLPARTTASLIEFYFNHVRSFIDIVNPEAVSLTLYRFQNNPNEVQGPDRCIFYLVLAVALALDSGDSAHSPSPEFKHQLFAIAEGLAHPTRTFEKSQYHDDVLWPIQALALMSFFMLSVSMRNTAYEYCGKSHRICMRTNKANNGPGRAVRAAYALGIHRGHESEISQFPANEDLRVLRRNVWRSLFVLDRFLAATLGRPFAISDNEYSESSLRPPNRPSSPNKVPKRDMLDPPVDAYIYAQKEHLSLIKDAMFVLKTWYASSPYAEQFASKLDLFRHEVERQEQVKAIRQASRRQTHKVKRETMTTYEPSQFRSPFQQMPRGSLVSHCDSRRASGTANHTVIKQEAGGYSGSVPSRPLFLPTDFNMD